MKKQFLILFAFISVLALSQVPQRFNKVIVTGDITSPKYIVTNSNNDSVLLGAGGRKSVESFKTDTSSLSARITTKEPLLPLTPSNPESRFLNGNKQWAEIVLGSGGYASNVYFTNLTSTIVGTYKQTSGVNDVAETIASGTCNNNELLIHTYLFEQPVGTTTIDAGVWRFTMNCAINSNVGDSKFKIVQFRRSPAGVETDMFTIYSNTIENTDYQNFIIETVQPSFWVDSLDHFGCRIYATTTTTVNKTISYKVGDGFASYLNTPLVPRHDQFRDKNGNPLYQHLTSTQVATFTATSANNTGDETLTSIKTKLGAATSVSDGYLKYQDFVNFDGKQPKLNGSGFVKSFSGEITYDANNYELAFSKNSGFNLPLGTTPGTVLEGRTFGTAAGSSAGDFLSSSGGLLSGLLRVDTEPIGYGVNTGYIYYGNGTLDRWMGYDGGFKLQDGTGVKTIWHSGNLTSSLTTNYIPKWNGSSLVNATAGTDYQLPITLTTNGTSGAATFSGNVLNVPNYGASGNFILANPISAQDGNIWIDGIASASIVSAPSITTSYINFNSAPNGASISGSVSGSVIFNMPFNGAYYKKVIINLLNLQGSASWTFTSAFANTPVVIMTDGLATSLVTAKSTTAVTVTSATPMSGILILEGY